MKPVFADTYYLIALYNPEDKAHQQAVAWAPLLEEKKRLLVTTSWVLTELADAFANNANRNQCAAFISDLLHNPNVVVIPPTLKLFNAGFDLYRNRRDKEWSLTDCISFVVMKDRNILEALTGDQDFVQAGFTALLKPNA